MFVLGLLAKLPTSLLVTSLALAASALPVESVKLKVLTPDNFDTTVAEGAWFIEHFSPYCQHCRAFMPTWEKLVQHYEGMDDPGVHLAQVDCAVNGDLCNKHGVTGYPQMVMYKNGEVAEQFKGARDWNALNKFIDRHAIHTPKPKPHEELSTQLDTASMLQGPPPNPEGVVRVIEPSTFLSFIDEGPAFIKFYAPWCGHCKKLAPIWSQLAVQLRNKLNIAEVNCEAYKDFCRLQDVKGFPTLFFYSGGSVSDGRKTEYTGGRKLEQMRKFVEIAIAPALQEVNSEADYERYVQDSSVLYLLLHSFNDNEAVNEVREASHVLLGSPKIIASSNTELRRRFFLPSTSASSPVLLAIKDGIPHAYTSLFAFSPSSKSKSHLKEEKQKLQEWLLRNRIPSAVALTQDTFQDVMGAPHSPLVVIAAVSPAREAEGVKKVKEAAREWRKMLEQEHVPENARAGDVVFTWMDAERWGSWLKSMYGIEGSITEGEARVVVADHSQLIYYDTNAKGNKIAFETQSMMSAVKDVLAGKVSYKNSENFIERMARRINNGIMSLEQAIFVHPYRTAFFFLGFLIVLVMLLKKFLADEGPSSYAEYTRLQKDANRLD